MLRKAKTARFMITLYQHITDKLPTSYRHITNCRPTVGRLIVYVLGKTCWPTVGWLMADRRPTDGRLSANRRPTDGQQSANRFFGELFFTITQAFTMNVELFCHLQGFHSQIEFVQKRLPYVESSFLESANSDHNFTVKHQSYGLLHTKGQHCVP